MWNNMALYKHLEIRQTHPGGNIGITLDGKPVKGCTDLTLSLGVDEIPRATMTVLVQSVDVTMEELGRIMALPQEQSKSNIKKGE